MKITEITTGRICVPLKTPFRTALRVVDSVDDVLVRVQTEDGLYGLGEAPPTKVITGDTIQSILDAVNNHIAPALVGRDIDDFEDVMLTLNGCLHKNTSPKAAVDMALYDLRAKRLGLPLYKLLGGYRRELTTDCTISVNDTKTMINDSLSAVASGHTILKLKVGKGGLEDAERVLAIRRAVGGRIKLRIDANQGWERDEAIKIIRALEDGGADMELIEQPVAAADIQGLKAVTDAVQTTILADESVFSFSDAVNIVTQGAADMINIKLMKTGGIYNALKICALAEEYGVKCMMGCMLESKLAVSAAAHLACAKAVVTAVDLDGPVLCAVDPFVGGPVYEGNGIYMTDAPGIGISGIN